jgi:hypothetical protein
MKVQLTKEIEINGVVKPKGLIMDLAVGYAEELVKKKKAKYAGNIETTDEKEFKTKIKKTSKIVEENNEIEEK